jgi:tRNA (guanine-N7-)-methyltransferase
MGKKKLQRFAEVDSYPHCFFMSYENAKADKFHIKGKWNELLFKNTNPIVLELGCGKAEYTVGLAKKYPQKNFIGVDVKGNRIWVGASQALNDKLTNAGFLRTRIENIVSAFDANEVDEIWITFPDPQPKKENKRLTSIHLLEKYKQFLKSGGYVHLKTDSADLYQFTLETIAAHKFELIEHTNNLYAEQSENFKTVAEIKTHYEKLFSAKGYNINYIKFLIN